MQDVLQWIALAIAFLWLLSGALRNGETRGDNGALADYLHALARQNEDLKVEVEALKKAVGYDEKRKQLDRDVIWDEGIRRNALGSLFPRVCSLEWKISDLHMLISDALKANSLKDPRTMSASELWALDRKEN